MLIQKDGTIKNFFKELESSHHVFLNERELLELFIDYINEKDHNKNELIKRINNLDMFSTNGINQWLLSGDLRVLLNNLPDYEQTKSACLDFLSNNIHD